MNNIYEEGLKLLKNKESFVLASIIKSTGSTPRSEGTKMIVRKDRSIIGTVGGGIMESRCMDISVDAIKDKKTFVYEFHLDSKDAHKSEMVCGGNGELLINYIDAEDENNIKVFEKAVDVVENNKKGWIVTIIFNQEDKKQVVFVDDKGNITGEFGGDDTIKFKLQNGIGTLGIHSDVIDTERYIVEKVHSSGKAFVFGAGHVSKEVATILNLIEFDTIVIDDREDFANKDRFPDSKVVVLDKMDEITDMGIDDDSYILIITRGHLYDYNVLEWALKTNAYYIGMIGSKTKIKMTYDKIRQAGFTDEDIKRVHAPIGIDLAAKTPAEIAVSIAGELINERAEKEKNLK